MEAWSGTYIWKEFGVLPQTSSMTAGCSSNLILPDLKAIWKGGCLFTPSPDLIHWWLLCGCWTAQSSSRCWLGLCCEWWWTMVFKGWLGSLHLHVWVVRFSLLDILEFRVFLAAVFCCGMWCCDISWCWLGQLCHVHTGFWECPVSNA